MRIFGRTLGTRLIVMVALLLTLASAVTNDLRNATGRWIDCVSHNDPRDLVNCPGQAGDFNALQSGASITSYSELGHTKTALTGADLRTLRALPSYTSRWHPPGNEQPGSHPGYPGSTAPGPGNPEGLPGPPPNIGQTYPVTLSGITYLLAKIKLATGQTVIVGCPLTATQNTIRSVLMAIVTVFASVLVLAVGVGIVLVRLSLRPLRRVAATATRVTQLPLDTGEVELPPGVPDTDPRTEVGQVGAAFNRMLGHVERALGRRAASESRLRRFAADASHELRTPLSAIRGYAELALRHPGPVPEEVTHALGRVQSESARMSVLVDDLLLLARLDAGRPLEREPVDLSRLAIDATSDARVARGDHKWRLDLPDDPVTVLGDEHRLHQVLANLLSNAGKHTPPGSTVSVALAVRPAGPAPVPAGEIRRGIVPAGPVAELSVTDNGPGIPAELLPELFERFSRADTSRSRDVGSAGTSTGLGLAIVDAVMSAHDGCVTLSSDPGGTRFALLLPVS
jgi:two-component system, OmpR family, sensor kinase